MHLSIVFCISLIPGILYSQGYCGSAILGCFLVLIISQFRLRPAAIKMEWPLYNKRAVVMLNSFEAYFTWPMAKWSGYVEKSLSGIMVKEHKIISSLHHCLYVVIFATLPMLGIWELVNLSVDRMQAGGELFIVLGDLNDHVVLLGQLALLLTPLVIYLDKYADIHQIPPARHVALSTLIGATLSILALQHLEMELVSRYSLIYIAGIASCIGVSIVHNGFVIFNNLKITEHERKNNENSVDAMLKGPKLAASPSQIETILSLPVVAFLVTTNIGLIFSIVNALNDTTQVRHGLNMYSGIETCSLDYDPFSLTLMPDCWVEQFISEDASIISAEQINELTAYGKLPLNHRSISFVKSKIFDPFNLELAYLNMELGNYMGIVMLQLARDAIGEDQLKAYFSLLLEHSLKLDNKLMTSLIRQEDYPYNTRTRSDDLKMLELASKKQYSLFWEEYNLKKEEIHISATELQAKGETAVPYSLTNTVAQALYVNGIKPNFDYLKVAGVKYLGRSKDALKRQTEFDRIKDIKRKLFGNNNLVH